MHGHCGSTGIFGHPRQQRRVDFVFVPPGAHLHGDGNFDGLRHRIDDAGRVGRFAHQAAAGVMFRDLVHRTSHVDVHDVGAHPLHDLRRFSHLRRVAAENLNGDGPFFLGVFGVFECAVDAAHQTFRTHHLGDDEAAPALAFHQAPKRGVGHPGHGGHGDWMIESDVADLQGHWFGSWFRFSRDERLRRQLRPRHLARSNPPRGQDARESPCGRGDPQHP